MEKIEYNKRMEEYAKTIYKILSSFERQIDNPWFDMDEISPDVLGISKLRRDRYLQMLIDAGYIAGIRAKELSNQTFNIIVTAPHITLKGLEFLAENRLMRRAYNFVKDAKDIIR